MPSRCTIILSHRSTYTNVGITWVSLNYFISFYFFIFSGIFQKYHAIILIIILSYWSTDSVLGLKPKHAKYTCNLEIWLSINMLFINFMIYLWNTSQIVFFVYLNSVVFSVSKKMFLDIIFFMWIIAYCSFDYFRW